MARKYSEFVEFLTDSRFVPSSSSCSICGKKLGFFQTGFWSVNCAKLADAVLCGKCADKIALLISTKNEWMKAGALRKQAWSRYSVHTLETMPLADAVQMIRAKEEAPDQRLSGFDSANTRLFHIHEAMQIEPGSTEVGIVRAQRLKNKFVVFGYTERGAFSKGDAVTLTSGNESVQTSILEAYVRGEDENTFDQILRANLGRHKLSVGEYGCLILELESFHKKYEWLIG